MKKMNNKGFSLVELIVVIAIMGVLMVILAPQYLRYVEKSRLQKDNTSISELAENIKIALAEDDVYQQVKNAGSGAVKVEVKSTGYTVSGSTQLEKELKLTVGNPGDVKLNSRTYGDSTVTLNVKTDNKVFKVTGVIVTKVDGSSVSTVF